MDIYQLKLKHLKETAERVSDMDKIKFAKLHDNATIPSKRRSDGCYDIYAILGDKERIVIQPHSVELAPTGLCSTFGEDLRISIRERGSNTKSTLMVMAGQIDSNYTGEWFVALYNGNDIPVELTNEVSEVIHTEDYISVPISKAVAQFAVEHIPLVIIEEVDSEFIKSIESVRGSGKLGSSGK